MIHSKSIIAIVMSGTLGVSFFLSTVPVLADTITNGPNAGTLIASSIPGTMLQTADSTGTSTSKTNQTIAAKLTQDQAVAIVKAAISIPSDAPTYASLDNNYAVTAESNHPVWNLGWRLGEPGDGENGNINAIVDAVTGTLLNLNTWKSTDQNSSFPPKITQAQAAALALDFIRKLQPDKALHIKEMDLPVVVNQGSLRGPFVYNLSFVRIVNDIPVPADGFHISVTGNGTITDYSFQWSGLPDSSFPDAKQTIPVTQASQIYDQNLKMQLAYKSIYGPFSQNGPDIHLVYQPNLGGDSSAPLPVPNAGVSGSTFWIQAADGSLIDGTGKVVNPDSLGQNPMVLDPNGQDTEPAALAQPLTIEQAEQIAKTYVHVDTSYSINQSTENDNGRKIYSFSWNKNIDPNSGSGIWVNATIDAATGQLLNFNFGKNNQQPPATVISEDAAKQKAIDFVKKVMPNKTRALYFIPQPHPILPKGSGKNPNPMQYSFSFGELVNGIPNDMNTVNIQINAENGDVESFYRNSPISSTEKTKYPDPVHAISADKAKALFEAASPLELQYVRLANTDQSGFPNNYTLVYAPNSEKPGEFLDAISGEWVSPYGQQIDQKVAATDIKGHWAEKQLQLMIDRGILDVVNGKVNPDTAITKGNLIRMLVLAIGAPLKMMSASSSSTFNDVSAKSQYFQYVETAVANHWIDKRTNFNPDAQVTREELAELVTRALGYEDLAKYSSIFNVPFADKAQIANDYLGDVAIVDGLGIMKGSDQNFNPKQNVTVAQAAVALVKTVEIINSKTTTGPIYYIKQLQGKIAKMKR